MKINILYIFNITVSPDINHTIKIKIEIIQLIKVSYIVFIVIKRKL